MFANTPFVTVYTAIIRSSHPVLFCKKGVLTIFAKFTRKCQKWDSDTNVCFFFNFAKFLLTSFLKHPSDGCFYINTRSVYCPTTTFHLFKKMSHIFSGWVFFFGLICRLGTSVSSIFQTLSQKLYSTQSYICDGALFSRKKLHHKC